MNMSYCRWQNTENDLRDCKADLEERSNGTAAEELSREEFEAACRLVHAAQSLIDTVRNAVDIYGEAGLTLNQIRTGMAKIEEEAQRYTDDED
jgi:hypothetical protein